MNNADERLVIRRIDLDHDRAGVLALDTSFSTTRIYVVEATPMSFALVETPLTTPLQKSFPLDDELDGARLWDEGFVAEHDGVIGGFVAVLLQSWNRRAAIWHLYVTSAWRGRGVGTRLLDAAEGYAREHDARCLWLETQNVNLPAIRFYRRMGFTLCGLDLSLYDPECDAAGETALYFMRDIH